MSRSHPLRERAIARLKRGAQVCRVAADFDIPYGTVADWSQGLGLRAKGQRGPDVRPRRQILMPRGSVLAILDLVLQGEKVDVIARSLGCTSRTVFSAMGRWDLP